MSREHLISSYVIISNLIGEESKKMNKFDKINQVKTMKIKLEGISILGQIKNYLIKDGN